MSERAAPVPVQRGSGSPVDLAGLGSAAARFRDVSPAKRAALARATARAVAAVAAEWAETATAIKRPAGDARPPEVLAEEIATGPLPTLRLLLLTAAALDDIAAGRLPRCCGGPRLEHAGAGAVARVALDLLPVGSLLDGLIWGSHRATVRCVDQGGVEAFRRALRREVEERPLTGGVAAVLGAGNVTGLAVADCISQVFEHGRAAVVKLHPLHSPLVGVLERALGPLVAAGLVRIFSGDASAAGELVAASAVTHVHLTVGRAAFDAVVRGMAAGGPAPAKPLTCELGNVTPWFIVPGRYTPRQLAFQADLVAASIAHNTSFNCIATKLVVTCRGWPQRGEFLDRVTRRLASLASRPGWYPGSDAAWETITGRRSPADGTLPCELRTDVDLAVEPRWADREWFVPVAAETAIDAADIEGFCVAAAGLAHGLPGSLAASATVPPGLAHRDHERVENLVGHLPFGVVAVNGWSAVGYALAAVPWGGAPGGTLAEPKSGLGRVHDPLLLPLVHNTIVRCPLEEPAPPPWVPWHPHGARLSRGLVDLYGAIARGRSGLWPLMRMLPATLLATLRPPRGP